MASETLILCYHAVSPRWSANLSVTEDALQAQLALLLGRGYRGVTFSEAILGGPHDENVVAVTFDDGFRSVGERALPLMEELGMPGTVFVPTSFAGQEGPMAWPGISQWLGTPHEKELVPMSWDDLRRLGERGWEIGSHSRTHPRLTSLGDSELREELEGSRVDCEDAMGRPCTSLAYPFGDVDARVVQAARAAGYLTAGTLPDRLHAPSPLEWPRVGISHHDGLLRFRAKTSPLVARLRQSKAWIVLGTMARLRVNHFRDAARIRARMRW